MKNLLLLTALAAVVSSASADIRVNANGLEFIVNTTDNTAELSSRYRAQTWDTDGYDDDVVIPAYVSYNGTEYPVTSIMGEGFYKCYPTSISMPETLKVIGYESLYEVNTLPSLVIPNSVETIQGGVFYKCSGLQSLTLGSGLKTIIGSNASYIPANFYGCTALTEITSLSTVPPTIDDKVFPAAVKSNVTLTVPAGCVDAYKNAPNWDGFKEYKEGQAVAVTIVEIDGIWYRLDGSEATVVAAPSGEAPYSGELNIPGHLTFEGADYTVTTLGESCFADNTAITYVDMPGTLTTIEDYAFNGTAIEIIYIPNSVTSVGRSFQNCQVLHLALGTGITSIPSYMCSESTGIYYISSPNAVPPTMGAGAFDPSLNTRTNVYFPDGAYNAYRNADGWKNFIFYNLHNTIVPTAIGTSPAEISGKPGDTVALNLTDGETGNTLDVNTWYQLSNISWTSSNPEVATVDEDGNVTLVAEGTADIRVSFASILTPLMTPLEAVCAVNVSTETGIDAIETTDAPARYFNLQGIEVARPEKGQTVIEVRGNASRKVVF